MATSTLALLMLSGCTAAAAVEQQASPVSKVVTLLKDIVSELEHEAEEDEEVYEAMTCWCDKNEKEKTKSIADAEARIGSLTTTIEDLTANSARLNTEIPNLEKEISKNSDALDKATALRKKELAEFNAEEKESLSTIGAVKSAVVALSKHHEASFLQTDATDTTFSQFRSMAAKMDNIMHKHADDLAEIITPKQRRLIVSFLQSPEDYFKAVDAHAPAFVNSAHHAAHKNSKAAKTVKPESNFMQAHAPASGEIFGMLNAMKDSFETNLASSQKDEATSQADYEDLKAAKEEEIAAGQALVDSKTQEVAASDEKVAQSKEDLVSTRESLAADTKFLGTLKETCGNVDAEFEERTKTRQLEIQAVSKALAFLSSDDAHALFSRSLGFVQMSSTTNSKRRDQVSKVLSDAAEQYKSPRLSALALKARMDAFAEVRASISDMIEKLKIEQKDEVKKKDFCVEEINTNERDQEQKKRDQSDLEAKIDDFTMTIETLSKDIDFLKAEVAEMTIQLKHAGEDREKENKEFQVVIADQRATQKLLTATLGILKGFYEKAALAQTSEHGKIASDQAPPPGFKSYEKNKKSGGVMGMIQGIIDDSAALEAEGLRSEEDSQKRYEEFVKDTNEAVDSKTKDLTNKSQVKAETEADKVEAETELNSVVSTLEELTAENADLHKECDFTLKNFDVRQEARSGEIGALTQALAIFKGNSFIQVLNHY